MPFKDMAFKEILFGYCQSNSLEELIRLFSLLGPVDYYQKAISYNHSQNI